MSELQDLAALIRANTPLIVVETPDEPRVVELFRQSLQQVWRALYRWTITEGLRRLDLDGESDTDTAPDASNTLAAIREAEAADDAAEQAAGEPMIAEQVGAPEIAEVVGSWTGIPVGKLLQGETEKLLTMEDVIGERLIGQRAAVAAVAAIAAGLRALGPGEPFVVVLAADMPFLSPATVAALVADADATFAVDAAGRPQYLVGRWRRRALEARLAALRGPQPVVEFAHRARGQPHPARQTLALPGGRMQIVDVERLAARALDAQRDVARDADRPGIRHHPHHVGRRAPDELQQIEDRKQQQRSAHRLPGSHGRRPQRAGDTRGAPDDQQHDQHSQHSGSPQQLRRLRPGGALTRFGGRWGR